MATFGYTSVGASVLSITSDQVHSTQLVNLPEDGIVSSILFYAAIDAGAPRPARAVIYRSDNSLVAYGSEVNITADSGSPAWNTSYFQGIYLPSGDYYLGFGFDATFFPGTVFYYYDTVASANRVAEAFTYNAFPATATPAASTRQLSIYAEYIPVPLISWMKA